MEFHRQTQLYGNIKHPRNLSGRESDTLTKAIDRINKAFRMSLAQCWNADFINIAVSSPQIFRWNGVRAKERSQNANLANSEKNRAFVLMQYFGYLRRNPNDLPDSDYGGYSFWLGKLKQYGNWQDAQMVLAFISSPEYRARFGPP